MDVEFAGLALRAELLDRRYDAEGRIVRLGPTMSSAHRVVVRWLVSLAVLSLGAPLRAQVFRVEETPGVSISSLFSASIGSGARALGMGGAFIAVADDGTAASWNPAGLCVLEKPEMSVVSRGIDRAVSVFSPTTSAVRAGGVSRVRNVESWTVENVEHSFDFVSVAYPVRHRRWKIVPQFSFQRAIDLGGESRLSMTNFRETVDSYTSQGGPVNSVVTGNVSGNGNFSGGLDIYAVSLGASLRDDLFFGVSFNWWRGDPVSDTTFQTNIQARQAFDDLRDSEAESVNVLTNSSRESFRGFNGDIGVLYRVQSKLRLGFVYKFPFELRREIESTDVRLDVSDQPLVSFQRIQTTTQINDRTERGRIQWPRTLGFGMAINPSNSLTVSTDFTWSDWSDVTYEVSFAETHVAAPFCGRACQLPSGIGLTDLLAETIGASAVSARNGEPRSWPTGGDLSEPETDFNLRQLDTRQFRFGVEYLPSPPRLLRLRALPVRAGIFTDRQYFKQSNFTSVNYLGLTAGIGVVWTHLSIDLAYVHKSGSFQNRERRDQPVPGWFVLQLTDHQDELSASQLYVSAIVRF